MAKQYVVVGQVATINVRSAMGIEQQMLYQGAILPPGCDPEKIKHLISVGLVAEVTDPDDPETNPAAQPDVIGTGPLPATNADDPNVDLDVTEEDKKDAGEQADSTVDKNGQTYVERFQTTEGDPAQVAANQAKEADAQADEPAGDVSLPTDGSAPAESANKATWVEYAVSKGMDRTEATKASKKDLIEALSHTP